MIAFPTLRGPLAKRFATAFDTDYQAILTQATSLGYTLPSPSIQSAGNSLVVALKAAGLWNKLDVLYMLSTDGDSNFATLNWKSPTTFQASLVNAPIFTGLGGFAFTGTAHISTNFNPAINGVNYILDDASRLSYITTQCLPAVTPSSALDGITTATVNSSRNASTTTMRINGATSLSSVADWQGAGLRVINRISSTDITLTNGSNAFTLANASSSVGSSIQFAARSGGGYFSGSLGAYGIGASLAASTSAFLGAINNYFASFYSYSSFDGSYRDIIDQATSLGYALPSAYTQYVQNKMILDLKAAGIWNKLDVLYSMDNDASTVDFATLNWKDPTSFQLTLVNSPTWVPEHGIQTSGTAYLDTNFTPSSHGVNYALDSASIGLRHENIVTGTNYLGTVNGATGLLQLSVSNTAANFINSLNSLGTTSGASSTQRFRIFDRSSSTAVAYRAVTDAVVLTSPAVNTQTSTGLPTTSVFLGRSGTTYFASIFRYAFLGGTLTDSEKNETYRILQSLYGSR